MHKKTKHMRNSKSKSEIKESMKYQRYKPSDMIPICKQIIFMHVH